MPSSSSHLAAALDLFVAPSCTSYYCANRYQECVKHFKMNNHYAVPSFQRAVLLIFSLGHIWTKSSDFEKLFLRVCVRHTD